MRKRKIHTFIYSHTNSGSKATFLICIIFPCIIIKRKQKTKKKQNKTQRKKKLKKHVFDLKNLFIKPFLKYQNFTPPKWEVTFGPLIYIVLI